MSRPTFLGGGVPQTTTHNEKKNLASALPCSSGHYAAAGQIAITRWRTPTKLTGDPDLPLHNTPSEVICASCFTLHLMSSLTTSQRIYRCFYRHRCIFFNWSWGWPWNRCRVFRRVPGFKLFLCDEKKIQMLLHLNSRWQWSIHREYHATIKFHSSS